MKSRLALAAVIFLIVLATLACSSSSTPTPDTQATVNAAIAATSTAQAAYENSVDQDVNDAVAATAAAAPPTPTPGPTVEYITLTEEELTALINQAVNEAVAATNQASSATTQATSDGTLTQEEVETVEVYVSGAEEVIAYAEEVLYAYYDLYGELAEETLSVLSEIEQDLETMANNSAAMSETLEEINSTLQQGLTVAEETISQLETAAESATANLAETQAQAQAWATATQAQIEARTDEIMKIQPNQIAADQAGALQSAFDYVDSIYSALGDSKLTRDELTQIAQLGANASASLNAQGGPQLQGLSTKVNEITGQLARGQVPHVRSGVGNFEAALGNRPDGLPSGFRSGSGAGQPSRPGRP